MTSSAVRVDTQSAQYPWAGSNLGSGQSSEEVNRRWQPTPELQYRRITELLSDSVVTEAAAANASKFLQIVFERAIKLKSWTPPHITAGDVGEVVFEWWQGPKKITWYFDQTSAEYIKVWGADIDDDMASGDLTDGLTVTALWLWLNS